MDRAAQTQVVPSLMESQELLDLDVLEPALRKRRARHHRVATRYLVEVDVPPGGTSGREPEKLLGPHHAFHASERLRPRDQRRVTGV